MRSAFILMLMAATAVTPVASAAAQDRGRGQARAERPSRAERPQRVERVQRSERAAPQQRTVRADRAPRAERPLRANAAPPSVQQRGALAERRNDRRDARIERRDDRRDARFERRDDRRDARIDRRDDRRDARIDRRDDRRDRARPGNYQRDGAYRGDRNRGGNWASNRHSSRSWDRNWRNDRRYDWQRYRHSNRNIYRLGRYYSPYRNHHYSRFSVGLILGSAFYGSNYWISDPWQYRLPPAYPGTRWVRYYDDVMLVDTYTGEVLDVIYNFFW